MDTATAARTFRRDVEEFYHKRRMFSFAVSHLQHLVKDEKAGLSRLGDGVEEAGERVLTAQREMGAAARKFVASGKLLAPAVTGEIGRRLWKFLYLADGHSLDMAMEAWPDVAGDVMGLAEGADGAEPDGQLIAAPPAGQREASEGETPTVAATTPAVYLGDRKYQVGNDPPIVLGDAEDTVLLALLESGGAANKDQLIAASGKNDAPRVLKTIKRKYPQLDPHITMAEGKGKGGYRTTVRYQTPP